LIIFKSVFMLSTQSIVIIFSLAFISRISLKIHWIV